ncbi:hypothetical protein BS78_03G129300 [Paspalum vaginatum]|nr:hypothetical protein BS78_03G129300 [Paspalum vaginatum]
MVNTILYMSSGYTNLPFFTCHTLSWLVKQQKP